MKRKHRIRPAWVLPRLLALSFCAVSRLLADADADAFKFNFENACNEVVTAGIRTGMNPLEFADQQKRIRPDFGWQAWIKFAALVRAGFEKDAVLAFDELIRIDESFPDTGPEDVFKATIEQYKMPDVAMREIEWSLRQARPTLGGAALLMQAQIARGWSFQRAVDWIHSANHGKGDRRFIASRNRELQALYDSQGRLEELAAQCAADALKNLSDHALVEAAISATLRVMLSKPETRPVKFLEWLAEHYQPELASQARELGELFALHREKKLALRFLQLALEIPLTDRDEPTTPIANPKWRELFAILTMEAISEVLLKLDRKEEGQAQMLRAREMRQKHKIAANAFLSGMVQAATGARDVERELARKEALSENDAEYWLERASYYQGRKQLADVLHCTRRGLGCPMGKDPTHGRMMIYLLLFRSLEGGLQSTNESQVELVEHARSWLRQVPSDSQLANEMARWLSGHLHDRLTDADLEAILNILPTPFRDVDDNTLFVLVNRVDSGRLWNAYVSGVRANSAEYGSRAIALGQAYLRANREAVALDLLTSTGRECQSEWVAGEAWKAIATHFSQKAKWREAEKALMEGLIHSRGGTCYGAEAFGDLAVMAATDGDNDAALRLCKTAFACDPMETRHLERLGKTPSREAVSKFFEDLKKRFPQSPHPASALGALTIKR